MTNNYFRINHSSGKTHASRHVFFDDKNSIDTKNAYAMAENLSISMKGDVVLYRPTLFAGPWDELGMVGWRSPAQLRRLMVNSEMPGGRYQPQDRDEFNKIQELIHRRRSPPEVS